MELSVLEYGYIIYQGTSTGNFYKVDGLFFRGLWVCLVNYIVFTKDELCAECKISTLLRRRGLHLLLYMHKQSSNFDLLKLALINTHA